MEIAAPGACANRGIRRDEQRPETPGVKFVGTTIRYAFMQAVGMVNDHVTDCYRYRSLS